MFRSSNSILSLYGLPGLGEMFAMIDAKNAKEVRKQLFEKYDIQIENNNYGSPKLNIPLKYMDVSIKKGYLYFYHHDEIKIDLYDSTGKFLFSGINIENIGNGFFLVEEKENTNKDSSDKLNKLCNISGFVSEHYYRAVSDTKFTKEGYCILACSETNNKSKRKFRWVVINSEGKEVFINSGITDYLYLYGVVVSDSRNGYYSLLTGELLCKKGYSFHKTKNHLFINDHEKMHQINYHTGEVTLWE